MIGKSLQTVTSEDIQQLVANSVAESSTLEFKRELPGTTDLDKKGFLADVSAFANTAGGDLIFGIAESEGAAASVTAIRPDRVDAELLRLENLIANGLDPRVRYEAKSVAVLGGAVLIFRMEKSWTSPHRVTLRSHDKFYGRTGSGKFALNVGQLRGAFLGSATLHERLRSFRADRLIDILADRPTVKMEEGGKIIVHLLPFSAFAGSEEYDLSSVDKHLDRFRPMDAAGFNQRVTYEGRLAFQLVQGISYSYVHLHRTGIVEAVEGKMLNHTHQNGEKNLPSLGYERLLVENVPRYLKLVASIGVQPPVAIGMTLTHVKGAYMGIDNHRYHFDQYPVLEQHLILPEVVVNNFEAPVIPLLRPAFDRVWNAAGIEKSINFDDAGNWQPRQGFR